MSAETQNLKEQQYANGSKYNARIQLHALCSTNHYPWPLWVFDQLAKRPRQKILELGCGTGLLWQVNGVRVPPDWEITLSDFSAGMLDGTRANLAKLPAPFTFEVIDAQAIPYPAASFDLVIANHMLYHLPDRERGLGEIARVLKPGGALYATTIGQGNMAELKQIVREFTGNTHYETVIGAVERNFALDNGLAHLEQYFGAVRTVYYENSLQIKDGQLLTDYLLSLNGLHPDLEVLAPERTEEFNKYIENVIQKRGLIEVTTESGMFIAVKAPQ